LTARPGFEVLAITGLPEIHPGDDLPQLLVDVFDFESGDVLVLAQKAVSKSEGRLVDLDAVAAGPEAEDLARRCQKDARLVQLILDESREVIRVRPGLLIVEDRRGWVCANAGIDRSNVEQSANGRGEVVCLLPVDPDGSASGVREKIKQLRGVGIGVVISDSHGRPWRQGTVGVAIGACGVAVLSDRRGQIDRYGYELQHTLVGAADEIAAAASILMGQGSEGLPAVVLRGINAAGCGRARDLQRPRYQDLFR